MELRSLGNIYKDNWGTGFPGNVWDKEMLCPTLSTMQGGGRQPMIIDNNRIRRLTPLECWRLMNFSGEDFCKAEKVNSNTQLYKQAGNSIVCNVLVAIIGQMLQGKEEFYKGVIK